MQRLRGRRLIQSALGRFGYRLTPVRVGAPPIRSDGLNDFFALLKRLGFNPRHVLDVGANRGHWTRAALQYFPESLYTMIEPQDELRVCIQDLVDSGCKIRWIHAGASDKPGMLPFTIRERDDSSNFLLSEAEAQAAGLRRVTVAVRTVDEIIASEKLPVPEMVKIDAEGFDLKVLSGASSLIGRTEIFLIEADVRAGRPNTLLEVLRRMSENGYELLDITELNRSPKYGVLWLLELAFFRKGSRLLDAAPTYE